MTPFRTSGILLLFLLSQEPKEPPPPRAGYLVLEDEPDSFDDPEGIWMGYPSRKWEAVEKEGEELVRAFRKKGGQSELRVLEELRFIGRGHARDGRANKSYAHETANWKHVSDRAELLYGWTPSQWSLSNDPFPAAYMVSDNLMGSCETAKAFVDAWINSPPHNKAMLNPDNRAIGLGIAGVPANTAHLVFAGLPQKTYDRVIALQDQYPKLYSAKTAAKVKETLAAILKKKEGSSFIWILPLLRDPDKDVRSAAVTALWELHRAVPEARGIIFGLVDMGLGSDHPDVAEEARKMLVLITGKKFTKAEEWRRWWKDSWKTWK